MRHWVYLGAIGMCVGLLGCGDATSSTGEEGMLLYSLYTEYDVPETELTEARIVTGHEQLLVVRLTAEGRQQLASPDRIQHTVLPEGGVTVTQEGGAEGNPPDLRILVSEPGLYTLESTADGEVVDRLNLMFDEPAGFDLLTYMRPPWGEDFAPVSGDPIMVDEGAQVTFQAVPVDADDQRLAGDLTTTLSVDPSWAVVPGEGVIETYEGGVWTVGGEASFYFIDPALVSFTVTDPVSGASGEQQFDIAPVVQE